MKKIISVFIAFILLTFALCFPASATSERVITISEDYMEMYLYGHTYVRRETSMLYYDNSYLYESDEYGAYSTDCPRPSNYNGQYRIKLTEKQHNEVNMVEIFDANTKETLFNIVLMFNDGSELHIDFIREDLINEYNKITGGKTDDYAINFMWPEDNSVSFDKEKFYIGNKAKIDQYEYDEEFPVNAESIKGGFVAHVGALYKINDQYYFYSYIDNGFESMDDFIERSDTEMIEVIQLTDKELINEIEICLEKYYDGDYGYIYNEEFTEPVAKIFFIIVFAIAPAVVCIVTFILALKSKKALYKKLLFATSGISVAETITFIYIAFTLFNN